MGYHLRIGEYSRWFLERIKDVDLAKEAEAIEVKFKDDPIESRAAIRKAIEKRYTLPADGG
jgi:hypothetical protein